MTYLIIVFAPVLDIELVHTNNDDDDSTDRLFIKG